MNQLPTSHLEIPQAWGWYRPPEHLARILRQQLEQVLPKSELLTSELVLFHQDRDDVLLRLREPSDRFTAVHLARNERGQRIDFAGTFAEFAAREQRRHEIEQRRREIKKQMNAQPRTPNTCPVCFAAVIDEGCGGIWTGSSKSKARNGPLHHATCKGCRSQLTASPTCEEAEAGIFVWELFKWGSA